ncbi:hypothetical protein LMG667_17440 [Xanthomonas euvesicatoria]|nr:hypothetical protein LMG667_17440 [Xanthomonas euvesicatoria]
MLAPIRDSVTHPEGDPPSLILLTNGDRVVAALDVTPIIGLPDREAVAAIIQTLVADQEAVPDHVVLMQSLYMRIVGEDQVVGERVEYLQFRLETVDGYGAMMSSKVQRSEASPPRFEAPELVVYGDEVTKAGGVVANFYKVAAERAMADASATKRH